MTLSAEVWQERDREKTIRKYETELRRIESMKATMIRILKDIDYEFPKDYEIHHVREKWLRKEIGQE